MIERRPAQSKFEVGPVHPARPASRPTLQAAMPKGFSVETAGGQHATTVSPLIGLILVLRVGETPSGTSVKDVHYGFYGGARKSV